MTPVEKATSLKLLSALAWADGVLTAKEIESLVDFISEIGPWQGSEIKDVLRNQAKLSDTTLGELGALSPPAVATLLSAANRMANGERPATESEATIIRRAAEASMGKARWDEISAWLDADRVALEHRRALFGSH